MMRKGFWESTGFVATLVLFVVGAVLLIAFLFMYANSSGTFLEGLNGKIMNALCNNLPTVMASILKC